MSRMIEYRTVQNIGQELTVDEAPAKAGGKRILRGYAAIWGSPSQDLGGFKEIIRKGAFKKTIKDSDIRGLWNHESKYVLGRKSAGTLRLLEDDKGLAFSITPPPTQWASDLLTSVSRRDISGVSFAFTVDPDGDTWARPEGRPVRELLSVTLMEISIVTFPAYLSTEVFVREQITSKILAELTRRRVRLQQLVGK